MTIPRFACCLLLLLLCLAAPRALPPAGVPATALPSTALAIQEASDETDDPEKPCGPGWWIGVCCEPTTNVVRQQLGIDGGLAVVNLAKEGPAQRAGLEKYDILLTIGGETLGDNDQLNAAVAAAEGAALELSVLRRGQTQTISLVPEKRPPCETKKPLVVMLDRNDNVSSAQLKAIQEYVEANPEGSNIEVLFVRPGVVLKGESGDTDPTGDGDSSDDGCPKNVQMHLKVDQLEKESVLLSSADLDENNVVSGCLFRLLHVVDRQIATCKQEIEVLRQAQTPRTADGQKTILTSDESGGELPALESHLRVLEQIRDRLRREAFPQLQRHPAPETYPDEQSQKPRSSGRSWS